MLTKRQLLEVFTDQGAIAAQLGISKQAVLQWKMDQPIPHLRELQLRALYPRLFGSPKDIVRRDIFKPKKETEAA